MASSWRENIIMGGISMDYWPLLTLLLAALSGSSGEDTDCQHRQGSAFKHVGVRCCHQHSATAASGSCSLEWHCLEWHCQREPAASNRTFRR